MVSLDGRVATITWLATIYIRERSCESTVIDGESKLHLSSLRDARVIHFCTENKRERERERERKRERETSLQQEERERERERETKKKKKKKRKNQINVVEER